MNRQIKSVTGCVVAVALSVVALSGRAMADPDLLGGAGVVVFGVASYGGGPNVGPATYIPNNFTFNTDILTSPGGGFQTADTSIPNNIAEHSGFLPGGAFQIGGANGNGVFGAGEALITGPAVYFNLLDVNPDGFGAAAYLIASWNSFYKENGGFNDTYGNALAIHGTLSTTASAVAVSLRTNINSLDEDAPWDDNGEDLPELVLAISGNGNFVATGATFAAMIFNPFNGEFWGVAFNNLPAIEIPDGVFFTVTSTLTAIGDPAAFDTITPDSFFDIFTELDTGPPPAFLAGSTTVPEPASLGLLAVAGLALVRRRR